MNTPMGFITTALLKKSNYMNIIIPIGGAGKRFSDEGYLLPKPLINSLGKSILFWNLENLRVKTDDVVYIVYREEFEIFNFQDLIRHNFRNYNFKFIPIKHDTRGASETVLYALNSMSAKELDRLTIVVDSDNFYQDDIIKLSKEMDSNLIFYFKDYDPNPIYSYLKLDGNKITAIKEKEKISDNACVGAYCFKSGTLLSKIIKSVLVEGKKQKGEYYISALYDHLIHSGETVLASEISGFTCLGTPHQVRSFSSNLNVSEEKYRFCFDLDNTLVSFPQLGGDYSTVKPIQKNINFLNFLHDQGHTIIIHSARRMKTHNGDVEKVKADIEKVTLDTLAKFDVKYDEIYFGKAYAHFYIDDLALKPSDDLEKETGFYNVHPQTRVHNRIETYKDHIIKYSSNIEGEKHYYSHIPKNIKHLFPEFLQSGDNYIKLNKVQGIPISFLNTNKTLTENIIINVLKSINTIHNSAEADKNTNIYHNYNTKLRERLNSYDFSQYDNFESIKNTIINYLKTYEAEKRGTAGVIHGDPVFTNILIDNNNNLKFIDMRGRLGNELTIFGDIFYDYAKVYQSIIGYDSILMDKEIDLDYVSRNKKIFEDYIKSNFGEDRMNDIKPITGSLLLSMLPLHTDNSKCIKYFNLVKQLLA